MYKYSNIWVECIFKNSKTQNLNNCIIEEEKGDESFCNIRHII